VKLVHLVLAMATAVLPALAFAEVPPQAKGDAPEEKSRFDRMTDRVAERMEGDWKRDPMGVISGDMTGIVSKLSEYQTDKPVQAKQEKVVSRLEELIKELEKQCSGGGSSSANPNRPLDRSRIIGGPGGQGDMIDPRQGDKQWANLPAKQREQILQSRTEGFPPGYEAILQSYYRRLSQEQVMPDGAGGGADAGASVAPSPAPSPTPRIAPAPATKPVAP
jgi:hypothetical protein